MWAKYKSSSAQHMIYIIVKAVNVASNEGKSESESHSTSLHSILFAESSICSNVLYQSRSAAIG